LAKAVAMASTSLETMRRAGEEWLEFIDWLAELAREVQDAPSRDSHVRKGPKPASPQPSA
jgi:hypothetical protein